MSCETMFNSTNSRRLFEAAKDGRIMISMPFDINSNEYQNRLKSLHKMNRINYDNNYTITQSDIIFERNAIERYVRICPKLGEQ